MTAIAAMVVGLTFLFGFGNVWTLALALGVPPWVAPLVAPAVDLSVIGLLLAIRYLALHGAGRDQIRPARCLLIFASTMTLALNVTAPLIEGQVGKAAFDAVGPLLLIGWAEVGPGLLQAIAGVQIAGPQDESGPQLILATGNDEGKIGEDGQTAGLALKEPQGVKLSLVGADLLKRARQEDARHRELHQRPISAETLRRRLHVGAARARMLVGVVRSDAAGRSQHHQLPVADSR
ncbi:SpdA protein [Streptomyces monticola]|uniref:SpdA protein n=1 Tax=Streptomyces monticola TaxID=2666263 RepID=A0ABW2JB16_9ACTN